MKPHVLSRIKNFYTRAPAKFFLGLVLLLSLLMTISLSAATYDIRFWPTDSYSPYLPAAAKLFELPFFSSMHTIAPEGLNRYNMRGKETLILGIALMQRILNDKESLFPNVFLLILAMQASLLLVYLIFKRFFGPPAGFIAFLLLGTTFWPYLYILQGAHQPLVLMFFLLTFFFLQKTSPAGEPGTAGCWTSGLAGLSFGFMSFSSPTAIIFTPYFFLLLLWPRPRWQEKTPVNGPLLLAKGAAFLLGLLVPCLLFLLPDPVANIQKFIRFILYSQQGNHFNYYSPSLALYFPPSVSCTLSGPFCFRGGGWLWLWKYSWHTLPFLFPAYLLSLGYLLLKGRDKRWYILWILGSLSTPLLVETAQVVQFGRNYFSWLPGILFAVVVVFAQLFQELKGLRRKIFLAMVSLFLGAHILFNAAAFTTDIFPTRMAIAFLHKWLAKNHIQKLLVYEDHPRNLFTAFVLNHPRENEKIALLAVKNTLQGKGGYVLLPPISGKTIWNDCATDEYYPDHYIEELFVSGELTKYALAGFPTQGASRFWHQEEEVCTYRDLVLGQITQEDRRKGWVYILDADKIYKEWFPSRRARPVKFALEP